MIAVRLASSSALVSIKSSKLIPPPARPPGKGDAAGVNPSAPQRTWKLLLMVWAGLAFARVPETSTFTWIYIPEGSEGLDKVFTGIQAA